MIVWINSIGNKIHNFVTIHILKWKFQSGKNRIFLFFFTSHKKNFISTFSYFINFYCCHLHLLAAQHRSNTNLKSINMNFSSTIWSLLNFSFLIPYKKILLKHKIKYKKNTSGAKRQKVKKSKNDFVWKFIFCGFWTFFPLRFVWMYVGCAIALSGLNDVYLCVWVYFHQNIRMELQKGSVVNTLRRWMYW